MAAACETDVDRNLRDRSRRLLKQRVGSRKAHLSDEGHGGKSKAFTELASEDGTAAAGTGGERGDAMGIGRCIEHAGHHATKPRFGEDSRERNGAVICDVPAEQRYQARLHQAAAERPRSRSRMHCLGGHGVECCADEWIVA